VDHGPNHLRERRVYDALNASAETDDGEQMGEKMPGLTDARTNPTVKLVFAVPAAVALLPWWKLG
jgi:hypothetical protein